MASHTRDNKHGEDEEEEEEGDPTLLLPSVMGSGDRDAHLAYTLPALRATASPSERAARQLEQDAIRIAYLAKCEAFARGEPVDDPDFVKWASAQRWKDYYAHPSMRESARRMRSLHHRFMMTWAPNNRALLEAWMTIYAVNFDRIDRRVEIGHVHNWANVGYQAIRATLSGHPRARELTDLASMAPLVAQGIKEEKEKQRMRPAWMGETKEATHWDFYRRVFLPSPDRMAVALPVGLVLFEGRRDAPSVTSVLRDRVRRVPFSTSWHPGIAIHRGYNSAQAGESSVFAHKIMSDGILGVDVRYGTTNENDDDRFTSVLRDECEVIVQPLVSFHLVHEADVFVETMFTSSEARPSVDWRQVAFTHAFLGDVCPCEAQKEAVASPESSSHHQQHPPESKRQRLQGRLQLD